MRDEHVQWFSEYLLEKRVRFEFNLHSLYSDLLDQIGNEELDVLIISKTLENIRVSKTVYREHDENGGKNETAQKISRFIFLVIVG